MKQKLLGKLLISYGNNRNYINYAQKKCFCPVKIDYNGLKALLSEFRIDSRKNYGKRSDLVIIQAK